MSVLSDLLEAVVYIVTEYIIYGSIFVAGLIILLILHKRDKRPYMTIAAEKTEKLIKRTDKILQGDEKQGFFLARVTQIKNSLGDLIVLAEQEVTGNRNVAYDGALSAYKQAYTRISNEELSTDKQVVLDALSFVRRQLEEALKIISAVEEGKKKK